MVVTAMDGYEALARVEEVSPDVIVLDFEMPGINGDEVLEVLRSSLTTRSIPVVFLTGIDDEDELNALITAGAVGYIVKPFDPKALAGDLESILAEVSDHELLS